MTAHLDDVIPENSLIKSLSPQWQSRFEKAIIIMRTQLDVPFNWQDISQQCATSASHFHVMFRTVFGETPAVYHRRMRLKQVLFELYFEPCKSISDIALDAGFATSQSLAKVLNREFNCSAKEIRQQNTNSNFEKLRCKVEHVLQGKSLESHLSKNITFSITTLEAQYLFLETSATQDLRKVTKHWLKITPKHIKLAVSLSPWQVIEDISTPYQIGYHCSAQQANTKLDKQSFLTCRVKIIDGTSYLACWESLFYEAMRRGYEVNEQYGLLEYSHNPRSLLPLSADITMMIPINIQDHQ